MRSVRIVGSLAAAVGIFGAAKAAVAQDNLLIDSYAFIGIYSETGQALDNRFILPGAPALGLACDGSDIYVAIGGSIREYSNAGVEENQFPVFSGFGGGPAGIAVSGSDIFVTQFDGLGEYTRSGQTVSNMLNSGFIGSPAALAVSGDDLFVATSASPDIVGAGAIGEFNTSGMLVAGPLISGLTDPIGLGVSGSNLFVLEAGLVGPNGEINEYTLGGTFENQIASGLLNPLSMAVDGSDIFVLNEAGTMSEYSMSGTELNSALYTGLGSVYGPMTVTNLPEPASAGLLGVAAFVGLGRRRMGPR
jgi:hypothetical protein